MPISDTVPLKSSIEIISPTVYSFSKIMKIPAIISAISDCAPKPTINVNIPTDSHIAVVLTPNACNIKKINAIAEPYLTIPSSKVNIVLALLLFCINFLNSNLNNLVIPKMITISKMQCITFFLCSFHACGKVVTSQMFSFVHIANPDVGAASSNMIPSRKMNRTKQIKTMLAIDHTLLIIFSLVFLFFILFPPFKQ